MKQSIPGSSVSATDAAFLYLERKEVPLSIASVCIFDGPIPFRQFLATIDRKLDLVPRYRQIPIIPPWGLGFPIWQDDPKFDVRRHVIPVTLPSPGGEAELEVLASRLLSQVLERNKPLWDVHVVGGLNGGRGALIWRLHHALADGVSGAELMKVLLDATPEGSPVARKRRRKMRGGAPPSLADTLSGTLNNTLGTLLNLEAGLLGFVQALLGNGKQAGPAETRQSALKGLAGLLPEFSASIERLPFNKPCTGERRFCWAEFAMSDLQSIREGAGGTVNDIVLAVVTRALGQYVKLHGESVVNRFVRIVCPVNLRLPGEPGGMGNQISFLPVALPLGVRGPVRMLQAVTRRTETLKRSGALGFVALAAKWFCAAPPPLQAFFWRNIPDLILPVPLLNMICTNVAGSPTPLYAAGRRMLSAYPQVPTGWDLGVGIAAHSYDGRLFFGLIADTDAAPDVDRLRDYLVRSFNELYESASVRKARGAQRARSGAGQTDQPPGPAANSTTVDSPSGDVPAAVATHSMEAA